MTDAEQVACDALRSAGLDELADNLDMAKELVSNHLRAEVLRATSEEQRAQRMMDARMMRTAVGFNGMAVNHQSGRGRETMCGGPYEELLRGGKGLGYAVTCPACLHVLFGPGTTGLRVVGVDPGATGTDDEAVLAVMRPK